MLSQVVLASSFVTSLVSAHGYIANIKGGAQGAATMGFQISKTDAFLRSEVAQGIDMMEFAGGCGGTEPEVMSTITPVDIPGGIAESEAAGLPSVDADGKLQMQWAQFIAGDDASGPGTCKIDITGKGDSWEDCTMSKQFGDGGAYSFNDAEIQLDPKTVCTGGSGSTCLLKVFNKNQFGTCFAVKSPASSTAPSSNPTDDASTASATATMSASSDNTMTASSDDAVTSSTDDTMSASSDPTPTTANNVSTTAVTVTATATVTKTQCSKKHRKMNRDYHRL